MFYYVQYHQSINTFRPVCFTKATDIFEMTPPNNTSFLRDTSYHQLPRQNRKQVHKYTTSNQERGSELVAPLLKTLQLRPKEFKIFTVSQALASKN